MSNKPMTDDEIREWLEKNEGNLTPAVLLRKAYEQHFLREEAQRKKENPTVNLKDDDRREIHELSPIELFMRGYLEKSETKE